MRMNAGFDRCSNSIPDNSIELYIILFIYLREAKNSQPKIAFYKNSTYGCGNLVDRTCFWEEFAVHSDQGLENSQKRIHNLYGCAQKYISHVRKDFKILRADSISTSLRRKL